MVQEAWQLRLVKRSIKKREKLALLTRHLSLPPDSINLDLGCAQGILSHFLRTRGGQWFSADLDLTNVRTSRALLKTGLLQLGPLGLPFKDEAFHTVVSLDYLEHLDDDEGLLREVFRILKPGGRFILATPRTGRLFLLNRLRPLLGMRLEYYGHKREGYTLKRLASMLRSAGFLIERSESFAGFFSEALELALNWIYIHVFRHAPSIPRAQELRDGHIRPSTEEEFTEKSGTFRAYGLIYPLVWLISRLDRLFFWQRGYGLMVWAGKPE